jgi:hypothetical protein
MSLAIQVELFGQLRRGRKKVILLQLEAPIYVNEVVLQLGLDPEQVGMVVINGIQSELTDAVPPESRLCLFPYISGG